MDTAFVITDQTRISAIIDVDKNCIEAIASVAQPLRRLKNPILRKVMASRVTLAEAAKMGNCSVMDIAKALAPLGFIYEGIKVVNNTPVEQQNIKPVWLTNAAINTITYLDVRPTIAAGNDPLQDIIRSYKSLESGQILCVINSFIPTPLIRLLEKNQHTESYVEEVQYDVYNTYFLKPQDHKHIVEKPQSGNGQVYRDDTTAFERVLVRFSEDKRRVIDVRHMEMPMPMQTILAELKTLPKGHVLYVHHKRVPVYLLEELADQSYEIHILTIEEGNVKMMIF